MNPCMAILAKSYEAGQVLQFMAHDGCAVYPVSTVMYLQAVRFAAHLASVSVADADFALHLFPIGIILQALSILARSALDVRCPCHCLPPFRLQFHPYPSDRHSGGRPGQGCVAIHIPVAQMLSGSFRLS